MGDGDPGPAGFLRGFSPGSQIAGYRLGELIGQGGMAVVFLARDERLHRRVALKILSPALAADEKFRRRFILESRSAAGVDDPHIIPVFEAGDADGVLFIAMRYVPGGDVGALLRHKGPLPVERAAAIISGVASALDTAHAAGLVHRDIKPTNMLLDARVGRPDHVYLSDFGLSKGALTSADASGSGRFMGTLNYCAPEQIQGRRVDARTDEYSLACTAFELLSGGPPFSRNESSAVMYAQLSQTPPRLTSRRPGLPAAVDDVLLRALAKAPEGRYASCGEFADALRSALGLQQYAPDVVTALHERTLADERPKTDAPDAHAGAPAAAPDALLARFGEAQEIAARGDHARAEQEFRALLPYLRRSLGQYHPDTLATRCSIAREMAARGDHAGAEREFRDVLVYLQRKPGLDHPVTVILWANIAKEMVARGDHAGAEEEFRDLLPHLKLTLGRDHPDTLAVLEWIDYLQAKNNDRFAESRPSSRGGRHMAMPPAHPGEGHPGHGLAPGRLDLNGRHEYGSAQPGAGGR